MSEETKRKISEALKKNKVEETPEVKKEVEVKKKVEQFFNNSSEKDLS